MPRSSSGTRLWLRAARRNAGRDEAAVWIIRDGRRQISTGCGAGDRAEAERRLAAHIESKYSPIRRERPLSEIRVADVINIYLLDVVPGQARPAKAGERAVRLLAFFGVMNLDEVNGAQCRAYEASRKGKGRSNKGTGGGARRDLQDLAAAINHHAEEGLHRGAVRVALPPRGKARQRWLTRSEVARLLWTCWRAREVQEGAETDKRPLRHLCRFLLLGVYTGSRPGAVLRASWVRGPGLSRVDTVNAVFDRHAEGARETNKAPADRPARAGAAGTSETLGEDRHHQDAAPSARRHLQLATCCERQDGFGPCVFARQAVARRDELHVAAYGGVMACGQGYPDAQGRGLPWNVGADDSQQLRSLGPELSGRSGGGDRTALMACFCG
jgi:hypothetical protein